MTDENTPTCPKRPACDGCPRFEASLDDTLQARRARVVAAVDDYPARAWPVAEAVAAPSSLGYRNRARMVVASDAPTPAELLGFYQAGTRELLPVEACPVHHPAIERVLGELRPLLYRASMLRHAVRFVDIRVDREGAQGILTLAMVLPDFGDDDALPTEVADALRRLHEGLSEALGDIELGLHANVSATESAAILSGRQIPVVGPEALTISVSGADFEVPPQAFFQVNPAVLEAIHEQIRPWIADASVVADLYAGVGVHGLTCAPEGARVIGFDSSPSAIEAARRNADANARAEADFAALADDEAGSWLAPRLGAPAAAIINPARAGMSVALTAALGDPEIGGAIERLAYVSCEPRTLTRDLDRLCDLGFRVDRLIPFDLMPRTDHVEVLALLERGDGGKIEGVRDFWPRQERLYDPGVSGPTADPKDAESVWIARVVGRPPKGTPPYAKHRGSIQVERLRNVGPHTVVRITAEGAGDRDIRERLRRWGYPVLGDEDFGDRNANAIARSELFLDRVALHCVLVRGPQPEAEDAERLAVSAPVPGQLMALFQLPRKILQSS